MTRFESPLAVPAGVSTGESYSSRSSLVRSTYPAQRAPEEVIMAAVNFAKGVCTLLEQCEVQDIFSTKSLKYSFS